MNKQKDADTSIESGDDDLGKTKIDPRLDSQPVKKKELNGPKGLEPTRYGDWESKGRCYDF